MSRRDDIRRYYDQSNTLQRIALLFYWCNMIVGLFSPFLPQIDIITRICSAIQGISAFLFLFLSLSDDCFAWYGAEAERRKNDIENAYGIQLGDLKTEGYYNNSLPPSMGKYAVNCMESAFFSKTIASKMLPKATIKALLSVTVMFFAIFWINDPSFLLVVVQAVLSFYFIEDLVRLIRYANLVKVVYETLFKSFITVGVSTKQQEVSAFSCALEYEAIKAHFKVRLDSKLFDKLNDTLSSKWAEICQGIKYSK